MPDSMSFLPIDSARTPSASRIRPTTRRFTKFTIKPRHLLREMMFFTAGQGAPIRNPDRAIHADRYTSEANDGVFVDFGGLISPPTSEARDERYSKLFVEIKSRKALPYVVWDANSIRANPQNKYTNATILTRWISCYKHNFEPFRHDFVSLAA